MNNSFLIRIDLRIKKTSANRYIVDKLSIFKYHDGYNDIILLFNKRGVHFFSPTKQTDRTCSFKILTFCYNTVTTYLLCKSPDQVHFTIHFKFLIFSSMEHRKLDGKLQFNFHELRINSRELRLRIVYRIFLLRISACSLFRVIIILVSKA